MLPAPTRFSDPVADRRPAVQVTQATLRAVPRLAIGHTAAIARRRPRGTRWVIWSSVLATALQLTGQVGRGEVFRAGRGSSVVLTPADPRRTPMRAGLTAVATYLLLIVVLPFSVVSTTSSLGRPAGTLGILGVAAYLLAIVLGPLFAAAGRGPRARPHPAGYRLLTSDGVRLHDLVRDPRDPPGTGIALLQGVLRDQRFAAKTIVTTAASNRLADAYEAVGMVPLPDSTTLYRLAHTPAAGVDA